MREFDENTMIYPSAEDREFSDAAKRVLMFAHHEATLVGADSVHPEHLVLGYDRERRSLLSGVMGVKLAEGLISILRSRHRPSAAKPVALTLAARTAAIVKRSRAIANRELRPVSANDIMVALFESGCEVAELLGNYGVSEKHFRGS